MTWLSNARVLSYTSQRYTLRSEAWKSTIAAGQSVGIPFGLQKEPTEQAFIVSDLTLVSATQDERNPPDDGPGPPSDSVDYVYPRRNGKRHQAALDKLFSRP